MYFDLLYMHLILGKVKQQVCEQIYNYFSMTFSQFVMTVSLLRFGHSRNLPTF